MNFRAFVNHEQDIILNISQPELLRSLFPFKFRGLSWFRQSHVGWGLSQTATGIVALVGILLYPTQLAIYPTWPLSAANLLKGSFIDSSFYPPHSAAVRLVGLASLSTSSPIPASSGALFSRDCGLPYSSQSPGSWTTSHAHQKSQTHSYASASRFDLCKSSKVHSAKRFNWYQDKTFQVNCCMNNPSYIQ